MARLLVALALLGAAFVSGTPTPPGQALPKLVLGLYESIPESESNFAEFAKVFNLPEGASFTKGNFLGFAQEGDSYRTKFTFGPSTFTVELPFKLGETQKTVIQGKNVEYVYTVEGGDSEPVLLGKFRETDGDKKFTVEAKFNENGINATYTRDTVVAKRSYRRTLPAYALGAFESVPSRLSANFEEFNNAVFPLPKGLKWTKDVKFWVSREGDHYVDKIIPDPTYYSKITFKLNEKSTANFNGQDVEYKYTITESTPNSTTVRGEFTSPKGTLKLQAVYDQEGVTTSLKSDKGEVKGYYKRVVPWLYLGTFEDVPEKAENWEEFMKTGGCKFTNATKKIQIYQQGDEYVVRKTLTGDTEKTVDIKFKLDTPTEVTLPNGKTTKYTYKLDSKGDKIYMRVETDSADKKASPFIWAKPEGIAIAFLFGDSKAKKFYRRVLPKAVFGTFESADDNEDFKAFAAAVGTPELLKKVTIEFSESKDYKYTQKVTPEGEETNELTFKLGDPSEFVVKGKTLKYAYYFFEVDGVPTLRAYFHESNNGPTKFDVVAQYTPEGYTATYTYDNSQKQAKRSFTRKSPQVPLETFKSA